MEDKMLGVKFGKLTVIERVERPKHIKTKVKYYRCDCECGKSVIKQGRKLRRKVALSCGCATNRHGLKNSKIYNCWGAIKTRCLNEKSVPYKNYGGRGIKICDEWLDFINFYNDMKDTYKEGLTLDRIDNEKGYFKENCRWVDCKVQANNKRTNVKIEIDGVTKTLAEWVDYSGICQGTLYWRYSVGKRGKELIKEVRKYG